MFSFDEILLIFAIIILIIIICFLVYDNHKSNIEYFISLNKKYVYNIRRNDRHLLFICFCAYDSEFNYTQVEDKFRNHILYEYYNDLKNNKYFNAKIIGPIILPTIFSDSIKLLNKFNPEKTSKIITLYNSNLNTDNLFTSNNNDLGFNNVDIIKTYKIDSNNATADNLQQLINIISNYDTLSDIIIKNYKVLNTFNISSNDSVDTRNTKYDKTILDIDNIITSLDNLNNPNTNKSDGISILDPVIVNNASNATTIKPINNLPFNPPTIVYDKSQLPVKTENIVNKRNIINMSLPKYKLNNEKSLLKSIYELNPSLYLSV